MHRTLFIAAFAVTVTLPARPQTFQPMPFVFFNSYTGMCLQPVNESTAPGAAIVQEPCDNIAKGTQAAAQEWIYVSNGASMHFENALSQLCLDARGKAKNKTPVQQWPCNRITNENWENPPTTTGVPVTSRVSGTRDYCLDVPGGQKTVGLAVQIYRCNDSGAQRWSLNSDGHMVVPKVTGLTLTGAQSMLFLYGLASTFNNGTLNCSPAQRGLVVEQTPGPGQYLQPKQSVTMTLCNIL
jgi:hypothetical protein